SIIHSINRIIRNYDLVLKASFKTIIDMINKIYLRNVLMKSYFQDLRLEFTEYNKMKLLQDLMAGATVAAVALPLALAFGVSSGASAASGLITAILAGFVISLFGGAYYQISGPTGAMAAILIAITTQYGLTGVFVATLMAGLLLIFAGLFHFGRVIAFIPMPVITGFTSGIAVIIALGQIDNLLGVKASGITTLEKTINYFKMDLDINYISVFICIFVVVFMLAYPKKYQKYAPASLIALIVATLISIIFSLDIQRIGVIPTNIILDDRFAFSDFDILHLKELITPAISIALLGMIESLLCGASGGRMVGVRLKCDRELIAQGLGNILVPFCGGVPATAAIARTSVAIKSGAVTRLTGIFHSIILLVSMLVLAPIMSLIPLSALAGILFVTAFRMNEWHTIKYFFKNRFKGALVQFFATMLATIIFDLTIAILIGVILSLMLLMVQISNLKIKFDYFDSEKFTDLNSPLPQHIKQAEVIYIMGAIIFSNTDKILELTSRINYKTAIIFSMRGTTYMDISGASAFLEVIEAIKKRKIPVFIAGVSPDIKEIMKRSGIVEAIGVDNFYWSVEMTIK
ncbi:SulP family inorganic anion transporter, partial [Campylobacter sp. RM9333]|uniref:SulP family inorganic anion transporter n=1 Tax=Campylobacter sp. RM9333 TaxID=2735731 RepID=UPI003014AD52